MKTETDLFEEVLSEEASDIRKHQDAVRNLHTGMLDFITKIYGKSLETMMLTKKANEKLSSKQFIKMRDDIVDGETQLINSISKYALAIKNLK